MPLNVCIFAITSAGEQIYLYAESEEDREMWKEAIKALNRKVMYIFFVLFCLFFVWFCLVVLGFGCCFIKSIVFFLQGKFPNDSTPLPSVVDQSETEVYFLVLIIVFFPLFIL